MYVMWCEIGQIVQYDGFCEGDSNRDSYNVGKTPGQVRGAIFAICDRNANIRVFFDAMAWA